MNALQHSTSRERESKFPAKETKNVFAGSLLGARPHFGKISPAEAVTRGERQ